MHHPSSLFPHVKPTPLVQGREVARSQGRMAAWSDEGGRQGRGLPPGTANFHSSSSISTFLAGLCRIAVIIGRLLAVFPSSAVPTPSTRKLKELRVSLAESGGSQARRMMAVDQVAAPTR